MSILENIGAVIVSAAIVVGGWFGYTPDVQAPEIDSPEEALGADTNLYVGGQTYTLAGTGVSSSATSFTLTSFTITQNGKKIQDSEMADTFYLTFEPGSRSRQEFASCTTVTQNSDNTATLSGCTRGLSPVYPYTASTSLQFAHAGGTSIIFSNSPQFYDQFTAKGNDEIITGQWTFTTFPITASSSIASATTSGIVELATGEEAASSTLTGDIAASKLALHTGISTSSAPASGNVVVVTGDDGNIDYGFLPDLIGSSTVRYITTLGTTTYTKPTNLKYIEVQVQGAGGGGNGYDTDNTTCCGESGAGGGYARKLFQASDLPATTTIFVGTGGTGGQSNSTPTSGTAGGESKFYTIVAGGGSGGGVTSAFSTGGSATGGDINISGMGGQNHRGSAQSGNQEVVTMGGDSVLGKSGMKNYSSGTTGIGYGFGGSGGHDNIGENAYSGGNGIVIIREYF